MRKYFRILFGNIYLCISSDPSSGFEFVLWIVLASADNFSVALWSVVILLAEGFI